MNPEGSGGSDQGRKEFRLRFFVLPASLTIFCGRGREEIGDMYCSRDGWRGGREGREGGVRAPQGRFCRVTPLQGQDMSGSQNPLLFSLPTIQKLKSLWFFSF